MTARYEDARGQRVVIDFHRGDFVFDFEDYVMHLRYANRQSI
jgi:hypothetical protein